VYILKKNRKAGRERGRRKRKGAKTETKTKQSM
jgi:hypothetical protein